MRELVRLKGLERVGELTRLLRARGIDAVLWQTGVRGGRCAFVAGRGLIRLMVAEKDLVYARWILSGAGVESWSAA